MNDVQPLLTTRLSMDYPGKSGVLREAVLEILPGETVGLIGGSGSGKSSMALALLGLAYLKGGVTRGEVRFHGQDLLRAGEREMRSIRGRRMAFVPQSPMSALNPAMRIGGQMVEAWKAHRRGDRSQWTPEIRRSLEQVGLPSDVSFLRRYPAEVSVGQAQRVLIAMAILHGPELLIADEPTSSLDAIAHADVLRLLLRLNRELGMACLYISHDLLSVASFCRRAAILHHGSIVEQAETEQLFRLPAHPYTRALLDAMPVRPDLSHRLPDAYILAS